MQGTTMNLQEHENLGDYLTAFLTALNCEAASEGTAAFQVEVLDDGLNPKDVEKLR